MPKLIRHGHIKGNSEPPPVLPSHKKLFYLDTQKQAKTVNVFVETSRITCYKWIVLIKIKEANQPHLIISNYSLQ